MSEASANYPQGAKQPLVVDTDFMNAEHLAWAAMTSTLITWVPHLFLAHQLHF